MKSVLIAIQPKWCELIASGKKTVEVRKTKPKLDPPFKCYIYCTKDPTFAEKTLRGFADDGKAIYYKANKGKVIGEFVCDEIFPIRVFENGCIQDYMCHYMERSLVPYDDIAAYIGKDKTGYGWHISDLEIYDMPKELGEFAKLDKCPYNNKGKCIYAHHCYRAGQTNLCGGYVEKPPQSWCYVEEGD